MSLHIVCIPFGFSIFSNCTDVNNWNKTKQTNCACSRLRSLNYNDVIYLTYFHVSDLPFIACIYERHAYLIIKYVYSALGFICEVQLVDNCWRKWILPLCRSNNFAGKRLRRFYKVIAITYSQIVFTWFAKYYMHHKKKHHNLLCFLFLFNFL